LQNRRHFYIAATIDVAIGAVSGRWARWKNFAEERCASSPARQMCGAIRYDNLLLFGFALFAARRVMDRLKLASVAIFLMASVLTAQARIAINGPGQSGARTDRVVAVLLINLPTINLCGAVHAKEAL
jgi:hypothetical protein